MYYDNGAVPEDALQEKEAPEAEIREPVVKMWTPLHLRMDADYTYVPDGVCFRTASALLRRLAYTVLPLVNRLCFGLQVEGRENLDSITGGAVTVCNHVHILDCGMVACTYDDRRLFFPTLKSNLEIPFVRHLVRLLGGFPIPDTLGAMRSFSTAVKDLLLQGNIVHLYPEGVLVPYYDGVRKFRKGAFTFAYDCHVPVAPFLITYRTPQGLQKITHRKPLLTLHILPPVEPRYSGSRAQDIAWLCSTCSSEMKEAYRRLSGL